MKKDKNLTCYGCCHSAAMVKFPSRPSGERPCCFCIRNPELLDDSKKFIVTCWYDGSKAIKLPMDCYHSLDMLNQIEMWSRTGRYKKIKGTKMNDFEKWINSCPKNVPSIEEIRKITSKIPYSMVKDSLGELEEELKECCKRYAEQYTVNGNKRHYLLNYCPHCKAKLHPDADKQAEEERKKLNEEK